MSRPARSHRIQLFPKTVSSFARVRFVTVFCAWVFTHVASFGIQEGASTKVREIGRVELRDRMKMEDVILVDMRSPAEFQTLHIWGAMNIPHEQIEELGQLLPDNRITPVIFYGLDAKDSIIYMAAEASVQQLGYREVYVYRDGFSQWRWHGYFLSGKGLHDYLARRKDDPRDRTDRPEDVMNSLGATAGSIVADIGAGYGYFTLHLANRAGKDGKVYSIDIIEDYVDQLRERIAQAGISNVQVILGDVDNPHLPKLMLDGILIFDTYHEMSEFSEMLLNMRKGLKSGGRLVIVDYEPEKIGELRTISTGRHTVSADTAIMEVEKAGFTLIERKDEFITGYERGSMYLLLFMK